MSKCSAFYVPPAASGSRLPQCSALHCGGASTHRPWGEPTHTDRVMQALGSETEKDDGNREGQDLRDAALIASAHKNRPFRNRCLWHSCRVGRSAWPARCRRLSLAIFFVSAALVEPLHAFASERVPSIGDLFELPTLHELSHLPRERSALKAVPLIADQGIHIMAPWTPVSWRWLRSGR